MSKKRIWVKSHYRNIDGKRVHVRGHYRKIDGSSDVDSMFYDDAENERLSEIISISDEGSAREAVEELDERYEDAGRSRRVDIIRSAQLAANRCKAQLDREDLSDEERVEMSNVARIYDEFVDDHTVR